MLLYVLSKRLACEMGLSLADVSREFTEYVVLRKMLTKLSEGEA